MAVRRSASAVSSPRLGLERLQFLDRMAQPIGLAQRALDVGALGGDALLRGAPRVPQLRDRLGLALQPAKGIEQPAVRAGIDQRAVVVLAVDFDQHARRGSSGPARSPAGR